MPINSYVTKLIQSVARYSSHYPRKLFRTNWLLPVASSFAKKLYLTSNTYNNDFSKIQNFKAVPENFPYLYMHRAFTSNLANNLQQIETRRKKSDYLLVNTVEVKDRAGNIIGQESSLLYKLIHHSFIRALRDTILPYCKSKRSSKAKQLIVFISYAWALEGSPTYEQDKRYEACVESIAEDLEAAGFKVYLDRWFDRRGHTIGNFLEKMSEADFLLPIGTKLYLDKYNRRSELNNQHEHVVRAEGMMLNYIATHSGSWQEKIIPVLLEGEAKESLPPLLHQQLSVILQTSDYYEQLLTLIRDMYDIGQRDKEFIKLKQNFFKTVEELEKISPEALQVKWQKAVNDLHVDFKNALKKHYKEPMIERLLYEQSFPVSESFINLAFIEGADRKQAEQFLRSDASRDEHSNSNKGNHQPKKLIDLSAIFEATGNQSVLRLLIEGRAGSGKTTLCQYFANQWALLDGNSVKHFNWVQDKEFVIWLPLRQLHELPEQTTLASYIHDTCLLPEDKASIPISSIENLLKSPAKVFFLFDGYDEILSLIPKRKEFFEALWSQSNWMLTSRPGHVVPSKLKINRHFENFGFSDEDIKAYVTRFFKDLNQESKIKPTWGFLDSNNNIKAIAHIPINLELICSVLESNGDIFERQKKITTTELYEKITINLLRRYLQSLSQSNKEISVLDAEDVERQVPCQSWLNFLEALAWRAMQRDTLIIKLDSDLLEQYCPDPNQRIAFVKELFLLKPTGEAKTVLTEQEYHFTHLTFQEYFAARYTAKRFSEDIRANVESSMSDIKSFVKDKKYLNKFENTWLFTVGILYQKYNIKKNRNDIAAKEDLRFLKEFFKLLNDEPRDLIGYRHIQLLVRCLEESECLDELEVSEKILNEMQQWLSIISNKNNKDIISLIQVVSVTTQNYLYQVLNSTPIVQEKLEDESRDMAKSEEYEETSKQVEVELQLERLKRYPQYRYLAVERLLWLAKDQMHDAVIDGLFKIFKEGLTESDYWIKICAADTLIQLYNYKSEVLGKLLKLFEEYLKVDDDKGVKSCKYWVAYALICLDDKKFEHGNFSMVNKWLFEQLGNDDNNVKELAVGGLIMLKAKNYHSKLLDWLNDNLNKELKKPKSETLDIKSLAKIWYLERLKASDKETRDRAGNALLIMKEGNVEVIKWLLNRVEGIINSENENELYILYRAINHISIQPLKRYLDNFNSDKNSIYIYAMCLCALVKNNAITIKIKNNKCVIFAESDKQIELGKYPINNIEDFQVLIQGEIKKILGFKPLELLTEADKEPLCILKMRPGN